MRQENLAENIDFRDERPDQIIEAPSEDSVGDVEMLLERHTQSEDRVDIAYRCDNPYDILR